MSVDGPVRCAGFCHGCQRARAPPAKFHSLAGGAHFRSDRLGRRFLHTGKGEGGAIAARAGFGERRTWLTNVNGRAVPPCRNSNRGLKTETRHRIAVAGGLRLTVTASRPKGLLLSGRREVYVVAVGSADPADGGVVSMAHRVGV